MKTHRNIIQTFILLALVTALCSTACAQDTDSGQTPPPAPPYVGALSGDFTLVKKYTYLVPTIPLPPAQQAAQDFLSPAAAKIKELDAVKRGAVRKDMELYLDGSSREVWRLQSYRFTVYSSHPNSIILDVAAVAAAPNSSPIVGRYQDASDFLELSWIQGPLFQGIQMQQGKKCYTYKQGDQVAWIDTATLLPVYLQSKTMQVSYTYSPPPNDTLELPKAFVEKLQNYKRATGGQF
jgi:hypothetical protein